MLREMPTAHLTAVTECRPDTQSYMLRVRAWSVPVRRDSSWTKTSSIRTLDCNNAGAWRSRAERDPSGELARNLIAADDRPPRNLDGSTTGAHNGFVARQLIPPQDDLELAADLQSLAWSCGITPNGARNGVWLRGTTLKNAGDGGSRRASARFRAFSNDGRDGAYHVWTVTPADEVGAVSQIIPVRGTSGHVTIPWRRDQAPAKVRATEVEEDGSRSPIVIEHQVDG